MKRLMEDLGELTGLDIAAAGGCAPVRDGRDASGAASTGAAAALTLGRTALHRLGFAAGAGRCRAAGRPRGRTVSRHA